MRLRWLTTALESSELMLVTCADPRISVAWCKQYDVPLNKVLTKTLLEKFTWATHVEADFEW